MITERIRSYNLFLQGFRDGRMEDPEKAIKEIREAFPETQLQLVRADRIAGKEHLIFAAKNAIDSFYGRDRHAKHLSMEFLLFASGEHQITEAIKLLGVTPSTVELVLAGLSETMPDLDLLARKVGLEVKGVPDDAVMSLRNQKKITGLRRAFRISDRELESAGIPGETEEMVLKRLLIERSAMLALQN